MDFRLTEKNFWWILFVLFCKLSLILIQNSRWYVCTCLLARLHHREKECLQLFMDKWKWFSNEYYRCVSKVHDLSRYCSLGHPHWTLSQLRPSLGFLPYCVSGPWWVTPFLWLFALLLLWLQWCGGSAKSEKNPCKDQSCETDGYS